ncbi:hypothetical protein COCC4DRAFT_29585 [Bipolaris maydis ATCC 48331]|uniref:Uncharacterized protein n=2 Tax=Cochliobolus heterostrophus TaxID=5016 RepID=M2V8A5_COCH5|nr:uncharacterized protein COCC4DRAFT_29585 [Bipolaris maydis ATCC 48331]EMD96217.1 hypothetical protein COCHEDRAFT_1019598 [Bipolaris maydis C5]ENI11076.1 hypothetical protein COCC4DRAFT_29585 [Bipolaris maydis ATCC 48331]
MGINVWEVEHHQNPIKPGLPARVLGHDHMDTKGIQRQRMLANKDVMSQHEVNFSICTIHRNIF